MSRINRFVDKRKTWLQSRFIPKKCLILLYHRIDETKKEGDPFSLTVSPENFSRHLKILKDNCNVISLPMLLQLIGKKEVPDKSAVITFDDGYANNLFFAKPLLEEFKAEATLFLTTGYLGKIFWWDILADYILNSNKSRKMKLDGMEFNLKVKRNKRLDILNKIHQFYHNLDYRLKDNFVKEIYNLSHEIMDKDIMRCMTSEEVQNFSKSPYVNMGCHTVRHFPLSSLNKKLQSEEILSSKFVLKELIQKEVTLFSYPHGVYNEASVNILKENSFLCGLTGRLGVAHNDSDPFRLSRLQIGNWSERTFYLFLKYWL